MEMSSSTIDSGRAFDWGRTSQEYARYRDIYPEVFYRKIVERGLCVEPQKVLDLGTGTGVLPRNMYRYGAEWTGIDASEPQIEQAKKLSAALRQNISYFAVPAEEISFPDHTFDVVTACQCFWYFDLDKLVPKLTRVLKGDGTLLLLYMAWLPFEDEIAGASEELVLQYNPSWSGAGERMRPIEVPDRVREAFDVSYHEEYELSLPFTRETWHGRMKACRGTGASLPQKELEAWERAHRLLLEKIAPDSFSVKHYAAMLELKLK